MRNTVKIFVFVLTNLGEFCWVYLSLQDYPRDYRDPVRNREILVGTAYL